jgi:triosephosphate isomerase
LIEAGVSHVIIGHFERRAHGETNIEAGKKVALALNEKIIPILCVGETARTQSGEHLNFIRDELQAGFADVSPSKIGSVIVAYEPIWAIGGEVMMSPRDMHEMSIFIRKSLFTLHGEAARQLKIIYGGAASESHSLDMLEHGDVTGLLVGHVSLNPERFAALLQSISK